MDHHALNAFGSAGQYVGACAIWLDQTESPVAASLLAFIISNQPFWT